MTSAARQVFDHAMSLEQSGDKEMALKAFLEALELAPDDLEIAYKAAIAMLGAGLLDEAASQLRRIVFSDPANIPARASLGNCQYLQGDLENAERNFLDVLEHDPDNQNALYGIGSVYLQRGQANDAVEPAKRLLNLLPDSAAALTLYADSRARDPQVSAANAAYRKALHVSPDYPPALIGLAKLLIRSKHYAEASDLARRAANQQPANAEAFEVIGNAQLAADNLEPAKEAYFKALSLAPGRAGLLLRLSIVHRKLDDNPSALLYAHQAMVQDPEDAPAGNALGAALAALGHPKDAKAVLTSVARKTQLDSETAERIDALCDDFAARIQSPVSSHPDLPSIPEDESPRAPGDLS